MANRFWVGGTGDVSDTAHWSTSSGGAGGASVPGTGDVANFDASSGGGTATLDMTETFNQFIGTGYTGTFDFNSNTLDISGSGTCFVAGSGMSFDDTAGDGDLRFTANVSYSITSNGRTLPCMVVALGIGPMTLNDALTTSDLIAINGGFVDGGFGVVCGSIYITTNGAYTYSATSTYELTGDDTEGIGFVFLCFGMVDVFTSATIKFTGSSANSKTFSGNDRSYGVLWLAGSGSGDFLIEGSNTFGDLKVTAPPHTVTFKAGATTTVTTMTMVGTLGNLITLESDTPGTPFTLSASAGVITVQYCDITDSTATGGASFQAMNSVDGGGNTGWSFASGFLLFSPAIPFA